MNRAEDCVCPACEYDLQGNPTTVRCPECGLEHDPQAVWFRPSGFIRQATPYAEVAILAFFLWLWIDQASRGFPQWGYFSLVTMAIVLISPIEFLWRRLRYHFPYEFLLINRSRIHWRLNGRPEVAVDWSEIVDVKKSTFFDNVVLRFSGPKRDLGIPICFRPKTIALGELEHVMLRFWEQARQEQTKQEQSLRSQVPDSVAE